MSMSVRRVSSGDAPERYPEVLPVEMDVEKQEVRHEVVNVSNAPPISEINRIEERRIRSQMIQGLVRDKFVINAASIEKFKEDTKITAEEILDEMIALGKPVAALGESGTIYLGTWLKFQGHGYDIYPIEFMLVMARNHQEKKLKLIKLSVAPSDRCKQFINELRKTRNGLLTHSAERRNIHLIDDHAMDAADDSYAPYSERRSGAVIQLKDRSIYTGSYLENAAGNSLSPLQTALVALVADGRAYEEIMNVTYAKYLRPGISYEDSTTVILKDIAPHAQLYRVTISEPCSTTHFRMAKN